jgi:membrane protein required for colicin V production
VTAFDISVLAIVGLSTLFAFVRGVIREIIALLAWIVGIFAAVAFTPTVGDWLPASFGSAPVRYLVAFVLILIASLIGGSLIAWPLAKAVRAVGLGFVDRFLGSIFGLARGVLVVIAFVLFAGLTSLPRSAWWQDSWLAGPLVAAALAVAAHLPRAWADALDYSSPGHPRAPGELKA